MSKVLVENTNLTNIANAIRGKNGEQTTYKPSEMANAISNIPSGGGDYNAKIDGSINYSPSYGIKGLISEVDLDGITFTNLKSAFQQWVGLKTIKNLDTSNCTNFYYTFQACLALETAPNMDTKGGRDFGCMFFGCTSLKNVPVYDWSNIDLNHSDKLQLIFYNCTLLTDESLNNIMASCISATHITKGKTLSNLGLTNAQIEKCQTLSNWDAFVSAGWSA